jgi:hypothetical protein
VACTSDYWDLALSAAFKRLSIQRQEISQEGITRPPLTRPLGTQLSGTRSPAFLAHQQRFSPRVRTDKAFENGSTGYFSNGRVTAAY